MELLRDLLRMLCSVGISLLLVAGVVCVAVAVSVLKMGEGFWPLGVGVALLTGSWLLARVQPDIQSFVWMGTGLFGGIETPRGKIKTKWLCLVIPLLPVRSYYVISEMEDINWLVANLVAVLNFPPSPYEVPCEVSPLPGLGLSWRSVGKTILWTLIALATVVAVVAGVVGTAIILGPPR